MILSLNGLDLIMVLLIVLLCVYGYMRGFVNSFLSIFGLLSALVVAALYAKDTSQWFQSTFHLSMLISRILAFAAIFVSAKIVLVMIGWVLNILTKAPGISQFNKISGVIFAFFEAFIIFYVLIYLLKEVRLPSLEPMLKESWMVQKITSLMPNVISEFLALFQQV